MFLSTLFLVVHYDFYYPARLSQYYILWKKIWDILRPFPPSFLQLRSILTISHSKNDYMIHNIRFLKPVRIEAITKMVWNHFRKQLLKKKKKFSYVTLASIHIIFFYYLIFFLVPNSLEPKHVISMCLKLQDVMLVSSRWNSLSLTKEWLVTKF